jgi:hypothetical protein
MSAKMNLVELTMEQHSRYMSEAHPEWGRWRPCNPDEPLQELYLNPWSRFHIYHEHHSEPGFGMERQDLANEQNVDISDRDAREFAKSFLETIGDHMSIYQLNIFIEEVTKARDSWEQQRQQAMAKVDHTK